MTGEYQVTINGERHIFSTQPTLFEVLAKLDLAPDRVAIELNRAIIKRADWDSTRIESGAELEIVQFVGGG